jgi:Fe-S-cluster containining protein
MAKNEQGIKNEIMEELEQQLERSGFFTHSALSNQANRINEIESFLYGLIDVLISEKHIEKEAFEKIVKKVRDEILQKGEHFHAGIAIRVDGSEETKADDFVSVNCDERLHLCKAACCKLNFALSVPEIESGKVKWDLGQPYFIRQAKSGYCAHLNGGQCGCSIYHDRPKVCRQYSCATDKRIWKDFEKMEINQEWLDENLQERQVHLQEVYMNPNSKIEYKSKVE